MPKPSHNDNAKLQAALKVNPYSIGHDEVDQKKLAAALIVLEKDLAQCKNPKDLNACTLSENEKTSVPDIVNVFERALGLKKSENGLPVEAAELRGALQALKQYAKQNEASAQTVLRGNQVAALGSELKGGR